MPKAKGYDHRIGPKIAPMELMGLVDGLSTALVADLIWELAALYPDCTCADESQAIWSVIHERISWLQARS